MACLYGTTTTAVNDDDDDDAWVCKVTHVRARGDRVRAVPHQWVRSRYALDDDGARNCEAMKMFRWINAAGVMTGRVGRNDDDDERRRAMTMKNDRVLAINRACDT